MTFSRQFSDFYHRNRLAILTLVPAFIATASILFLIMPKLQHYSGFHYSINIADGYGILAQSLADGNGFRWRADMAGTMIREPGYPLLLAATFKILGPSLEAARVLNLLLAVGIVLMLMTLARRITSDPRVPVVAALIFLLHPGTLIAEARGGVEILFIFVGFGFLLTLYWAAEKGGLWRYLLAGLALGVVVQVRSTPILFPGFFLLYAMFTVAKLRQRLSVVYRVAVLSVGMGLVMTPWVMRNYRLTHEFVPVSTLGGVGLQEGLCMCRNVSFGDDLDPVGKAAGRIRGQLAHDLGMRFEGAQYLQTFYDARDEVAFNRILFERAKSEYLSDPRLFAGCVGKNLLNFWVLGKTWTVTQLNMLLQIPLLALVFCGLVIAWRRCELRNMGILLTYCGSILIVHLIVVAEARYSIPVLAFLSIPAAIAVTAIGERFGGKRGAHENATYSHN
jgi:4-amino-4-deoxy-L-arabinose transferase-like glycosyltransferase